MLLFDLQMFAEEVEGDTSFDTVEDIDIEVPEEPRDTRSFEEMYEEGPLKAEEPESVDNSVDNVNKTNQQDFKNEQNAHFAAQRRQQEEAQRIADATQRARDEAFKELFDGQLNPYTNKPVTTEAEYREYQRQLREEEMRLSGISKEQLDEYVNENPIVQQASQIVQQQQEERNRHAMEMFRKQIDEEIAEISKYDPSIKSLQDLQNSPNFAEIDALVRNNKLNVLQAYRMVNFDQITQKKQDAAKQRTLNRMNGTSHMRTTSSAGGGDDIEMPASLLAEYKAMLPNASTREIKEHYKRRVKAMKG